MVKSNGLRQKPSYRGTRRRKDKVTKTYVAFVLDRSGSMASLRYEVIEAFNDQVDAIKKMAKEQDVRATVVTFSTSVDEATLLHRNARHLKPLKRSDYKPHGMTALYDALGDTITEFMDVEDYDDPDVAFLIVAFTDGQENSSKRFSGPSLKELVDETEEDGRWTITYLGTNQDVIQVAQDIGLNLGNVGAWTYTGEGLKDASRDLTYAIGTYGDSRLRGAVSTSCFYANTSVGVDSGDEPEWENTSSVKTTKKD